MLVTKLFLHVCLGALCLGLGASGAMAQTKPTPPAQPSATGSADAQPSERTASLANEETTVWFFEAPTLDAATIAQLEAELKDALSGDQGTHLLGEQAFIEHIKTRRPTAPECLKGISACASASSMTFDALQLALIIEVKLRRADNQLEAAYTLKDRRGQDPKVSVARGAGPRQLALAMVREIYNATGVIELTSQPPGARVMIDGADIGVTPLKHRLPAGSHSFTMSLPNYRMVEGELEVAPNKEASLERKLESLPAMLLLENVPPGALVYIEGMPPQDAAQPIELPAGKYNLELKAPGHESQRQQLELAPGESVSRDGSLVRLNPLLRDISREAIVLNRYTLRVSYDHALQWTTFRGARGSDDEQGADLEFRRHVRSAGEEALEPMRMMDPNGLRLEAAFHTENLGITLLSLGYISDSREQAVEVEELKTGERKSATLERVRKLQLKPAQLSYRLFYKNLVPKAELGFGVNFQWIDVRLPQLPNVVVLSQTEAFMNLGIGTDYFLTPRWFLSARYNAHVHFNEAVGAEHVLSFGIGAAFPNIFGFEPEPPDKI